MTITFTKDADWLDFVAEPTKPQFKLPEGAIDTHCHVFGPGKVFPFAAERKYTPCDASKEQLFGLRDFLGFDRNVIVQATCHGDDNSALVDALLSSQGRARGVATVRPEVSEESLEQMHTAGVRGVRFNFVKRLVDPKPDTYYLSIIERIKKFGWHVVIYFEADDLVDRWDLFTNLTTDVVVDHMGRPDVSKSVDGPEFDLFLRFMRENRNVWTKVTCPERLTLEGPPDYSDVILFARKVIDNFPDRVLWGTDWPHPNIKANMPDDGKLVDFIPAIAPTPELQRMLLVDNPDRLYWGEK